MAARAAIKDVDRGYRGILRRLTRTRGALRLTVGIHDDEEGGALVEGTDLTLAELGEIHEYGLGVPERSFIRGWVDDNEPMIRKGFKALGKALVKGEVETIEDGYMQMGALFVAGIQQRIIAHIPPPNAPSTIERKGSSTPLIDEGQLIGAITFQVKA